MKLAASVGDFGHRCNSFDRWPLLAAAALATTLIACGEGGGGGVIEDNLIRPGVTAMNNASVLACNADKAALTTALSMFEIMQGEPAIDQTALIEAGYLRESSESYTVVNGQIRPSDPETCS